MFIDGYLALLDGTGAELTTPGYNRQPVSFGTPRSGITFNVLPYSFGQSTRGYLGRAIYDAPAGGNLLLSAALPTPLARGRLPWDGGDAGTLRFVFTALTPFALGAAFSGTFLAGAVIGAANDQYDVQSATAVVNATTGNYVPQIATAPLLAGVGLTITRGELRASSVPA